LKLKEMIALVVAAKSILYHFFGVFATFVAQLSKLIRISYSKQNGRDNVASCYAHYIGNHMLELQIHLHQCFLDMLLNGRTGTGKLFPQSHVRAKLSNVAIRQETGLRKAVARAS
jgi:hypothetical protein